MQFWHGGNLDDYKDFPTQSKGRYEYGPGLYLTTHYDTAKKYSKGSRKLYLIDVEVGIDATKSFIDNNSAFEFINTWCIKSKIKEIGYSLNKYIKSNKIPANIFINVILNTNAIPSKYTNKLREFLVNNNIDYEVVKNAFGWNETMLVLYNMKKIKRIKQIKSTDKIEKYDL